MTRDKKETIWILCITLIIISPFLCVMLWLFKGQVHTSIRFQSQITVKSISPEQSGNLVASNKEGLFYCFNKEPEHGIYETADGKQYTLIYAVDSIQKIAAEGTDIFFVSGEGLHHIDSKGALLEVNSNITQAEAIAALNHTLFVQTKDALQIFETDAIQTSLDGVYSEENQRYPYKDKTVEVGHWNKFIYIYNSDDFMIYRKTGIESILSEYSAHHILFPVKNGFVYKNYMNRQYQLIRSGKDEIQLAAFELSETLPKDNYSVYDGKLLMLSQKWKGNGPTTHENQMTNNHKCDTLNIIDLETGEHKRGYESKPGERVLFADLNTILTYYDGKIQCRKLGDLSLIYEEDASYLKKPGSYSVELAVDRVFLYKNNDLLGNYAVR